MEPVIIVDSSEIHEGKLESVKANMNELVESAQTAEPRMIAYSVYLDEDHSRVTVFQMHPDSASAEYHLKVAAPLFEKFAGLLSLVRIDVYGRAGRDLLKQLRRKADMLGEATLTLHDLHAGFARVDQEPSQTMRT